MTIAMRALNMRHTCASTMRAACTACACFVCCAFDFWKIENAACAPARGPSSACRQGDGSRAAPAARAWQDALPSGWTM
eukprot:scaffold42705_cov54-Phaeocystis_antarctica.AAC.6